MSLRPTRVRRVLTTVALALLGIVGMLLVTLLEGAREIIAGDAHYVFAAARSLAYDGDLDLTNQYLVMGDRWGLGRDPATDGWRLPPREIGASLLMVPGLWLHHVAGWAPRWEGACACALAAASLGPCWLGCARAIDAARLGPELHGDLLAGAAVLGFVVPFYAVGSPGYSHAPDAAICAWLCWALLARRGPILVGVLLACAVLTRMQNLLWLLWPAWEFCRGTELPGRNDQLPPSGEQDRAHALGRLLAIAGLGLLGLAPQLWLELAHPGSVRGSLGWTPAFFDLDDLARDLGRVLVGVHGLIRWTPIAALALIGLLLGLRGAGAKTSGALAVLLGMWLLLATVRDVDGGDAFGARRMAGLVGVLALGLAQLSSTLRPRPEPGALPAKLSSTLRPRPEPGALPAKLGARLRINPGRHVLALALLLAVMVNLARTQQAIVGELSLVSPDRSPGHR